VPLSQLLIAAGERADIVVDFSKLDGKTIILTNDAKGPYPKGTPADPQSTGLVMAFRVRLPKNKAISDTTLPAALKAIAPPGRPDNSRDLALYEGEDQYDRLIQNLGTLAGPMAFDGPITEVIRQGDTEIWKIYNTTADTHPIHLHQVSFQIISRQGFNWKIDPVTGSVIVTGLTGQPRGPDANEAGWKDTARMNPGEVTIVEAKFDLPGKYVWHCHILEHEEHDMMRFFQVIPTTAKRTHGASTAVVSAATVADSGVGMPSSVVRSDHFVLPATTKPPAAVFDRAALLWTDDIAPIHVAGPVGPRKRRTAGLTFADFDLLPADAFPAGPLAM
jgi:spore coat protein A